MSIEPQIRSAAAALLERLTDDLRARLDEVVHELTDAAATSEAARLAHADAAFESRQVAALAALRSEHAEALEEAREAAVEELDAARAEAARAREALDAARAEAQAIRSEADMALAQAEAAVAQAMAQSGRHADPLAPASGEAPSDPHESADRLSALARAASAMDEASTLSEVLDALAAGLAAQAERSLVLVFKGDDARVWRRAGFTAAPSDEALSLGDHADLKAIVDSSTATYLEGRGADERLLGVATLPEGATGLAVPVAIGGQVAALVYADAGEHAGRPAFAGWAELVEVLARHAARCLEALTAMRASGYARPQRPGVIVPMPPHLRVVQRPALETPVGDAIAQAQRVARLLVSEIRLNREGDIRLGREAGDLGVRLDTDIERARQQYLARVADGVPGRDALFEDELIRTLANGNAELLRRPTGS